MPDGKLTFKLQICYSRSPVPVGLNGKLPVKDDKSRGFGPLTPVLTQYLVHLRPKDALARQTRQVSSRNYQVPSLLPFGRAGLPFHL